MESSPIWGQEGEHHSHPIECNISYLTDPPYPPLAIRYPKTYNEIIRGDIQNRPFHTPWQSPGRSTINSVHTSGYFVSANVDASKKDECNKKEDGGH
eukprot:3589513-Ditylum_brightwellii.AAC.1